MGENFEKEKNEKNEKNEKKNRPLHARFRCRAGAHLEAAEALESLLHVAGARGARVKASHEERLVGLGGGAARALARTHVGVVLGELHAQAAPLAAPLAAARGKGGGRAQGEAGRRGVSVPLFGGVRQRAHPSMALMQSSASLLSSKCTKQKPGGGEGARRRGA